MPAYPVQDGVRVVQGHVVEIKYGQHILSTPPGLDDTLNLVWGRSAHSSSEKVNCQNIGHELIQKEPTLWYNAQHEDKNYLQGSSLSEMEAVFFANESPSSHSRKLCNTQTNAVTASFLPSEQASDMARITEQEKLRQDAFSKGGPKLAFMKDTSEQELAQGALPTTMGRDSPAGSLTSLDSLDEVPQSESVTKGTLIDPPKVTGIIAKTSAKRKSSGKRRVTFSDSITFDDGVIGQLVTHQNQSTKYFAALYAKNVVETSHSIPSDASTGQASRHSFRSDSCSSATSKENNCEKTAALPRGQSNNNTVIPNAEGSAGTAKTSPLAPHQSTSGESCSFSVTHCDHPKAYAPRANACLESGRNECVSASRTKPSVNTGSDVFYIDHVDRLPESEVKNNYINLKDSLEITRDSLDEDGTDQSPSGNAKRVLAVRDHNSSQYPTTIDQHNKEDLCKEGTIHSSPREDEDWKSAETGPAVTYYNHPFFHPAVSSTTVSTVPSSHSSIQDYITAPSAYSAMPNHSSTQPSFSMVQNVSPTLHPYCTAQNYVTAPSAFSTSNGNSVQPSGFATLQNISTMSAFSVSPPPPKTTAEIGASTYGHLSPQSHNKNTLYQPKTEAIYSMSGTGRAKTEVISGCDASQKVMPAVPEHAASAPKQSLPFSEGVVSRGQTSRVNYTSAQQISSTSAAGNSSRTGSADRKPTSRGGSSRNQPKLIKKTNKRNPSKPTTSQTTTSSKQGVSGQKLKSQTGYTATENRSTRKTSKNEVKDSGNDAGVMDKQSTSSPHGEDDIINSIRRNMEKINMRTRSDAAQAHHQRLIDSFKVEFNSSTAAWQENQPSPDASGNGKPLESGLDKTRQAPVRVASATRRFHHPATGSGGSRARQAVVSAGSIANGSASSSTQAFKSSSTRDCSGKCHTSHANQDMYSPFRTQALEVSNGQQSVIGSNFSCTTSGVPGGNYFAPHTGQDSSLSNLIPVPQVSENIGYKESSAYGKDERIEIPPYSGVVESAFDRPNAHLKQSIALDRTPTDEEINYLWERVRTCLGTKSKQTAGSDSCVDRINVRRSRAHSGPIQAFPPNGSMAQNSVLEDNYIPHNASTVGGSTVGGLRRYGSYEVLRRNGSSDSFGLRRPVLLQQRAQKSRQSQQGKPPLPRQYNQHFSPAHSRATPSPSITNKGKIV